MNQENQYRPLYHSDINETFIIEPLLTTGDTLTACTFVVTNEVISCSGDSQIQLSSGQTIFNTSIVPVVDATIDVGKPLKRFRDINTVSGTSSVWTSTISVTTPMLDLGLDSLGNGRQITANNSVIQNDTLLGGVY
jgi:hypothetical protein